MVQYFFSRVYKTVRTSFYLLTNYISNFFCRIIFFGQNIEYKTFTSIGLPFVSVALGGRCTIGQGFKMNNKLAGNPIGRPQPCILFVEKGAYLKIGNNVGISQAAIVCHVDISIGNNVKIGGGSCIYDTDFHSLDPEMRKNSKLDRQNKVNKPVIIKDNAFIGAHSIILKGVTIGTNSVVGACAVVTRDIPDNEIWAGNPAKYIKSVLVYQEA